MTLSQETDHSARPAKRCAHPKAGTPAFAPREARSFGGQPLFAASHELAKEILMSLDIPRLYRAACNICPAPIVSLAIISIAIVSLMITLSGCGQTDPMLPDVNRLDSGQNVSEITADSIESIPHHIRGEWSVSIDRAGLIEVEPIRTASAHWDVTGFISPQKCPGCLQFTNLSFIDTNLVSVTVALTHPFPGVSDLDGFDVKGVALGLPAIDFASGSVSRFIENPDGYTARWSHDPWADLNPFLDYAIDNPERRFANGTIHEREFIARLPESGPLEFDYIIDACWLPPDEIDPKNPSLSPHCNEAYGLNIDVSGKINPLPGSSADVTIEFHDWQNDGADASVTMEIPSLINDPVPAIFVSETDSVIFSCAVSNEKNAPAGIYDALVRIRDPLNNPETDSLTSFQIVKIEVTDIVPELTGIEIEPDALSLPDTNSIDQFHLYGIYSDDSKLLITNSVDWDVTGTDLNGNDLASIDPDGAITRLSSKWWGGTATVTADYQGHHDSATAYCEDPFADENDVEFGELNEEGVGFAIPERLIGPPSGAGSGAGSLEVCSLGYGGIATLEFTDNVIVNEPGADFIVFENPFYSGGCDWNGDWQHGVWNETVVIEVSRDGIEWLRMPCDYIADNETCGIQPWMNINSFSGLGGVHPVYAYVYPDGSLKDDIDPTDPDTAGGDSFDLADVGLDWCRFVRLIDTGKESQFPGTGQYDDDGDLILDFGKMSGMGAVPGCAGFDGDSVAAIHSGNPLSVQ